MYAFLPSAKLSHMLLTLQNVRMNGHYFEDVRSGIFRGSIDFVYAIEGTLRGRSKSFNACVFFSSLWSYDLDMPSVKGMGFPVNGKVVEGVELV